MKIWLIGVRDKFLKLEIFSSFWIKYISYLILFKWTTKETEAGVVKDSWDDEDDDGVKDAWDDEEEAPPPPPPASKKTTTTAAPATASKITKEVKEMTEEEKKDAQMKADLDHTAELFGNILRLTVSF